MRKHWGVMVLAALAAAGVAAGALAQGKKSEYRAVQGVVLDPNNKPAGSAVVNVRNLRSHTVKVYRSDEAGRYRCNWLEAGVDYEIQAEQGNLASAPQRISGSDNRAEINMDLKLQK